MWDAICDLGDWIARAAPWLNAFIVITAFILVRESEGSVIEELLVAAAMAWVMLRAIGEHRQRRPRS